MEHAFARGIAVQRFGARMRDVEGRAEVIRKVIWTVGPPRDVAAGPAVSTAA